jgi:ubiquitin-conjugating enzyme E2 D/E
MDSEAKKVASARRRIGNEHRNLLRDPIPGCTAQPSPNDIFSWTATIEGPPDTVYEGGTFHLTIKYPQTYPFLPPKVRFVTKTYHPNIDSETGFVGLNILKEDWTMVLGLSTILLSLRAFLGSPDTERFVDRGVAEEYRERRGEFEEKAREWTGRFAKGEVEGEVEDDGA